MDNVLKPLLLGRGLPVPILVVFLGAMGGFVAIKKATALAVLAVAKT